MPKPLVFTVNPIYAGILFIKDILIDMYNTRLRGLQMYISRFLHYKSELVFTSRKLQVRVGNHLWNEYPRATCVPQGSFLSQSLFAIKMNGSCWTVVVLALCWRPSSQHSWHVRTGCRSDNINQNTYRSASQVLFSRLDPVCHDAICIATWSFKSTPIENLYVLEHEMPLILTR